MGRQCWVVASFYSLVCGCVCTQWPDGGSQCETALERTEKPFYGQSALRHDLQLSLTPQLGSKSLNAAGYFRPVGDENNMEAFERQQIWRNSGKLQQKLVTQSGHVTENLENSADPSTAQTMKEVQYTSFTKPQTSVRYNTYSDGCHQLPC